MTLNPYLHFNGNCKAAFDYYIKHLGAKMHMCMTYADAPPQPKPSQDPGCNPAASDKIMHARIQLGDSVLMGSDAPPGRFNAPTGFAISLNIKEPKEAERIYGLLSEKGQIFMPMEETFWAKRFAMFNDQFGVPWMINCAKENY